MFLIKKAFTIWLASVLGESLLRKKNHRDKSGIWKVFHLLLSQFGLDSGLKSRRLPDDKHEDVSLLECLSNRDTLCVVIVVQLQKTKSKTS